MLRGISVIGMILLISSMFAEAPILARERVGYTRTGLRDPFLSPFDKEKEEKRLKLDEERPRYTKMPTLKIEGMVWNSPRPQAIINGEIFNIGESIKGATIIEINREGVVFVFEGEKVILKPELKTGMQRNAF